MKSSPSRMDVDTALVSVERRLSERFEGRLEPKTVDRIVQETAWQWRDAPVTTFVPILVERYSRDRIERLLDAGDTNEHEA